MSKIGSQLMAFMVDIDKIVCYGSQMMVIKPDGHYVYALWRGRYCIYVGATSDLFRRLLSHSRALDLDKIELEECESRHDALQKEFEWVEQKAPVLNITKG